MLLTLDCETTYQITDKGDKDPSPYNERNSLVYIGIKAVYPAGNVLRKGYFFNHSTATPTPEAKKEIQKLLDECVLLIGHNLKFDLQWLLECGFNIPLKIWDTMLAEYVLARGQKPGMSLSASCERHGLPVKDSRIDYYMERNISFENIPEDIVEEYCLQDVDITFSLYQAQIITYALDNNVGLLPTLHMSNELSVVLTDMERNGICIDKKTLAEIATEYRAEKEALQRRINDIIHEVMGDTPINLNSPEQLSWVVYSRKIKNKNIWATTFNLGAELRNAVKKRKYAARMSKADFVKHVKEQTEWLYKTKATQCQTCGGRGKYQYKTKKGALSSIFRICKVCNSLGSIYTQLPQIAGLKVVPTGTDMVTAGGFGTNADILETLSKTAKGVAKEFMEAIMRLNAVNTYLETFVEGIARNIRQNGLLHTQFMQAVTATGRLSSRDPNFQNMPRGKTFPVRRAVVSRFKDGSILDCDFGKLEFVTAVFLSGDKQGLEDIKNDADIHTFTSDTLTAAGEPTDRQDAKPHTFKPLYGGMSGTPAQVTYYKSFLVKYDGIKKWQDRLQDEAIRTKIVRIPSGREYAFPYATRTKWGGATGSTQIKNYPVQGFATGDIVPCALIDVWKKMKELNCKSLLILTVHDNVTTDVHPEERGVIENIILDTMRSVPNTLKTRYGIDFYIPLTVEGKIGPNLLDGKKL